MGVAGKSLAFINKIFFGDSRQMMEIPDNSIGLMITSPPYNVSKQYDQDLSLQEYLNLIRDVLKETFRIMIPGGIVGLNIANIGRKPYIPLDCYIIELFESLSFEIIQEIIWDKGASAGGSCAWGSWKSASNPSLRDVHEYILIAQKKPSGRFDQSNFLNSSILFKNNLDFGTMPQKIDGKLMDLTAAEIYSNLWSFGTESAKRVNHPAPFRVELPYRLIQLFSKPHDIVLDPFMGSGSTAIAAILADRKYVGYDNNSEYVENANSRIQEILLHTSKI